MTLLGNLIWFVIGGWWNFLLYSACGLLFCMTIIGIPIGKALFQYAKLMVLPFGKVIVKETELKGKENVAAVRRVGGTIANLLWLPFGIATFLANIGLMIACAVTIVGIPAAIVIARSCKFLLWPVGAKVVTKEEYDNLILRRTITASINAAAPNAVPYTSYTPAKRKYEIGDFFSVRAWIGVGIALGISLGISVLFSSILVYGGTLDMPLLLTSLGLQLLTLLISAIVVVALALLISWIRSKISSTPFRGIRFSSVSDFFVSIRDLFVTLLEDIPFFRVVFTIIFFFVGGIPGLIGLLIGATMHRDSRPPADVVNTIVGNENTFSANQPDYQYQQSPVVETPYPQSAPNILVKSSSALWMPGLPILVTQADIAKVSPNSADISLLLAFQNLCDQPIIGVYFSARCSNLLRQELQPLEKQSVQDFVLNPGAVWSVPQLIPLPDNDTRRVELMIHNIVMADGSVWSNDAEVFLSPIPEQLPLHLPAELSSELQKLKQENAVSPEKARVPFHYTPNRGEGYWHCACGQINISSECIKCGFSEETVFQITQTQLLTEKRDNRLQEEARIREERRQAITEQQEAIKETAEKVGKKISAGGQSVARKVGSFWCWTQDKAAVLWSRVKNLFAKYVPVVREKCADGFIKTKEKLCAFYSGTVKPLALKAANFLKEKVFPHWKKILILTVMVILISVIADIAVEKYQEYRVEQARIQQEEAEEAARLEAERQQVLAEEEARKQREQEELRRLEEEKRRLEEEKRLAEEKKAFEEGLPTLFQTAFDAYSNGQVAQTDRLAEEITMLKKLVSEASFPWDGVYGSKYLSWRENLIEAMKEQLIIEYEEIIAERTLYEASYNIYDAYPYITNGLYYAGYHDFDGNQLPELLLVTIEEVPSNDSHPEYTAILEIYGEKDQKVVKYGSESVYMPYGEYSVELKRCQDNFAVYYSYHGYSSGAGAISKYFGVQNKQLCLVYDLSMQSYFINEYTRDYEYEYYNGNNKITSEEYSEIRQKYVSETRIYYNECYEKGDHGVLTEPVNRTIIVNGQELTSIGPLYMDGEYTLAPLRPVLEAMGIPVCADGQLVTILASTKKDTLDIHKDTRGMPWGYGYYKTDFNDTRVSTIAPEIIDGQMYVRLEPTVSLFGAAVQYSRTDRTFTITFDISSEDLMTEREVETLLHFSYEDAEAILLQHGYWVSGSEDEVDSYIYFKNGCAFWSVYVLPLGVEYEVYEEGWAFVGNSIHVTVTSNGELIW